MNTEENARLTLTGPGTPCGEWMRRYWIPVGISDELTYLPRAVRFLGEDLVLFRDGRGQVGLLGRHCLHRGTSLEYGQVDEEGIRCCYHGWLYDTEGRVLDMPAEPPSSTVKNSLRHLVYPCKELGGLIFAYMGPREKMPELPGYDFLVRPDGTRGISGTIRPYNWLQASENSADPVHTALLHTIPGQRNTADKFFDIPRFESKRTPLGMTSREIRSTHYQTEILVFPMLQIVRLYLNDRNADPEPGEQEVGSQANWNVPIDDTHHWDVLVVFTPHDRDGKPRNLRRLRLEHHDHRLNYEEAQRGPQDLEAQESQYPIARREEWHPVSSDTGVLMWENAIREGIEAVERGEDPPGIFRDPELANYVDVKPNLVNEPTELEPWRLQGLRTWSKRVGPVTAYVP